MGPGWGWFGNIAVKVRNKYLSTEMEYKELRMSINHEEETGVNHRND